MDQNSSNGTDKRSWRERLGIGAGKDMPRIADEFSQPAAAPAATRPASVKPAPMAPRPGVKAAPPRGTAAAAPSSASGEKLAEKLKAQREAQERLAEQRVQAARQRAEVKFSDNGNGKPKFTFAGEDPETAKPAAPPPAPAAASARPSVQVPPPPPAVTAPVAAVPPAPPKATAPSRPIAPPPAMTPAPMTPPRSPLGAERPVMPPRGGSAMPPPIMPTRPTSRYTPPPPAGFGTTPSYGSQMPPYRPLDPGANRGYGGGGYQPPPAYTTPPVSGYGQSSPRLNMPSTPAVPPAYGTDSYDTRSRTMRPPPRPAVGGYRDEYAEPDVFAEARPPRRATAGDYSQAYRDEQGYEEDLPPSRGPLLPLILLFLLALGAGLGLWWVYQNSLDKNTAGGQSGTAPVVEAPSQPAKVTPAPAQQTGTPKKLIYDRIVGDREVLGGDVINSEEVPAQPGDSTNLQQGIDPAAGDVGAGTQDGTSSGQPAGQDELVPLPLPPPPGDGGAGDQQGSLAAPKSSNEAMIEPAAGASQAADSSLTASAKSDPQGINSVLRTKPAAGSGSETSALLPIPDEAPPPAAAPSETAAASPPAAPPSPGTESITDDTAAAEPPPPTKKKVAEAAKKPAAKKATKPVEPSLGSEPIVLVPPASGTDAGFAEQDVAAATPPAVGDSGGIYGADGIDVPATTATQTPAPAPVKKKRTIADLFRSEDTADSDATPPAPVQQQQQQAAIPAKPIAPAPQPIVVQPAPQPQAPAGGSGYVVQLASFSNQADASKEYGRLKAQHGAAIAGLSPIVTQAVVGGSTRYRLAVGVMGSKEQASAVCAKLFAAGERDCLVRRQ